MLDGLGEQLARLIEIIIGVKKIGDVQAVLGPLFELVEVAIVREKGSSVSWLASESPHLTSPHSRDYPLCNACFVDLLQA